MTNDVDKTLEERGGRYGPFEGYAQVTQDLKGIIHRAIMENEQFHSLLPSQKAVILEGLDMISHKIGRIVNGDPTYEDNFIDIEGYSKLTRMYLRRLQVSKDE